MKWESYISKVKNENVEDSVVVEQVGLPPVALVSHMGIGLSPSCSTSFQPLLMWLRKQKVDQVFGPLPLIWRPG